MRLLDSLTGRRSAINYGPTYSDLASTASLWQQSWMSTSDSVESTPATFQAYVDLGYKSNGIVFAVMLARTLTFAQAEFKFQNLADRSLYGNPDLTILEMPWPSGSTGELLARMDQDVCLSGNFYAVKRDDGYLERLRPDWVSILLDENTYRVIGYCYVEGGMADDVDDIQVFTADEVAHWSPIPDPTARYRGMSPLAPIVREIDSDTRLTNYKTKFLDNAATPNLLLKYPGNMKPDMMKALADRIGARHGGSDNAFKTMVLDQGADVSVIGSNFAGMDLRSVQGAGETRIAAAFGVPPVIVGLSEGLQAATYSNYELAMRRFADLTMVPLWMSAAVALSKLVKVPNGSRLWYDTRHMPALRQTEKDRAETMQVFSLAAGELIRVGYDPMTVAAAIQAGDVSLLKHTGAIPTALYPNGQAPTPGRSEPLPLFADGAIRTEIHNHPVPQEIHNHNDVDARSETTIAEGAVQVTENVDATTAVLEGAIRVEAPEPVAARAVTKRVETDEAGRITAIIEEPVG